MTDLNESTVAVESETVNSPNAGANPVAENSETTSVQTDGQIVNGDVKLDASNLPPELEETRKQLLRDYHAKTQKLSEENKKVSDDRLRFERDLETFKNDSETLKRLLAQDWFNKAAEDERAKRSGKVDDMQLTDEQFELVRNDKEAFRRFVTSIAERMVGKVEPKLNQTQQTLSNLETEREFERVANHSDYKDFRELNDKGLLDNYLEQGYSYEAAYKQYKYDNEYKTLKSDFEKKAQEKAQEILAASRDGAVGKPGVPRVSGKQIFEAKNFDEAFSAAWNAEMRGVKDYVIQKKK